MAKQLSAEDYALLKKYEHNFLCVKNDYMIGVGIAGAKEMRDIYERVYGVPFREVGACASCEFELQKEMARLYDEYVPEKKAAKKK